MDAIRRIINNRLSILSGENKTLINKYALQIENAQKSNSINEETTALIKSGDIFFKSALYNIALNYYMSALEKFELANDPANAAFVEIKIGRAYYFYDLVKLAKEYITKAYQTLIRTNDNELIAYANFAMGTVEDNSEKSRQYFNKALDIQKRIIRIKPNDYNTKENLSAYLNANGQITQALKIAEEINNKWMIVLFLNNIGYAKAFEGKYVEAINIFNRSLKISKAAKLKGLLKNTYVDLSVTYRLMGDWQKSAKYREIAAFIVESLYVEEFSIQTSEMRVKYDTKKKELENELLKKEQIIMKEKIADEKLLNYFLIFTIAGISLTTFLIFFSRKKIKTANKLLDKQKKEINEQKKTLESLNTSLEKSEEKLNIAQATAHLANWEWDLTNGEVSFSKELPHIYGVDEEKIKSNFREIISEIIHPEDREQFKRYFYEDFNEMKDVESEYRIINDNKEKWISAKRIAIRDENRNVTRVFGTVQDITESKKSEEARIQLASQQSFTKQLLKSQEEERKRMAGDLHDSLGQDVLLIKNMAQLALHGENLDPFTIEKLNQINDSTTDIINMVREISFDLRPAHLERLGLTETIISLINRISGTTRINFSHKIDNINNLLPGDAEINFFRIIQEIISNVVKHSDSKNAEINIFKMDNSILVEINDDGKGLKLKTQIETSGGFGLKNILNRVEILNGELIVNSHDSGGTKLIIKIPV
ncbi:MAG: PAS domain-containing protein [Ignavibacteriales bacterium]|nr:PAS domain-containing protein [Ignavibacteriales bacterium]